MAQIENRIKFWLAQKGKSGRWLADALGVDKMTVSRWVNNSHQPTLTNLAQIAEVLAVPVAELIASPGAARSAESGAAKGSRVFVLFMVSGDGGAWHPSVWADVAEMVGSVDGAETSADDVLAGLSGAGVFQFAAGDCTYFVFSVTVR